ncbi:hypothetical protein [Paraburkholderia heleia]|uniref:hypothetical protein n=1 Tax=Paraburkholderia heleia TaxID=634127 RepID=UPI002AB76A0A|nr:hypothetical protein [Paraburkholderia heleia]
MSDLLKEMFRRKREEREVEAAPKNVAALAAENAKSDFQHAQLLKMEEAANAVELPEILDGSRPLYFEILPTQTGVVGVHYSRRKGFAPLHTIGELRHEDLAKALLELLADVQPHDINIYGVEGDA